VRVGIDAQAIEEVVEALRSHGDAYRRRVFTDHEVESCGGWGAAPELAAPGLAARFAAKESVIKVLRPTADVPTWREIEIVRSPGGWCDVALAGTAARLATEAGLTELEVSLSHTEGVAVAAVVAR
jgi:holo-[acyl-carrier protein] synthase